jgi:hypothetical protein
MNLQPLAGEKQVPGTNQATISRQSGNLDTGQRPLNQTFQQLGDGHTGWL